jgi:hypothetical protein
MQPQIVFRQVIHRGRNPDGFQMLSKRDLEKSLVTQPDNGVTDALHAKAPGVRCGVCHPKYVGSHCAVILDDGGNLVRIDVLVPKRGGQFL